MRIFIALIFCVSAWATEIQKKGPNTYSIPRSVALEYASDLSNTLEGATMKADRGGYRFVEIEKKSVFEQLGFKVGDVLTHVNGEPVGSPAQATAMIPQLALRSHFVLKITRDKKPLNLTYDLTD